MKESTLYRLNNIIITIIFIAAIFIPFSLGIVEKDKKVSKVEKRKFSQLPTIPETFEDIQIFPRLFEGYYSDHFGLRDWLTKHYKQAKFYMGDSASEDVIIGKNGWLFLGSIKKTYKKHGEYGDPIGDARNANLYAQGDLKRAVKHLVELNAYLNKKGIKYMLVIVPSKHSIYFDQLPDYITKINTQSATDQLVEYLQKQTNISVVDLRKALIKEKDKYQLYYKADTHWNHYGANIAQYEIMLEIEKLFPKQIQPELAKLDDSIRKGGDLAWLMGIYALFRESDPQPLSISAFGPICTPKKYPADAEERQTHTLVCEGQKLNTVIFRDSFFTALQPYFSRKFKRSTYIWEKTNYLSLEKYITLEKPDIVIEEWAERILPYVPFDNQFINAFNKKIFDSSNELIFSKEKTPLKFNKWLNLIEDKNGVLRLKAIGKDPVISFPLIAFKPNNKYILHINMTSSVQSDLQIFYSDIKQTGQPFSEKNSFRLQIKKGDNDIYTVLDYPQLSGRFRLDPISGQGEMTIKSLEIKRVDL